MNFNFESFYISILIPISLTLIFIGIKNSKKIEIQINKFAPNYINNKVEKSTKNKNTNTLPRTKKIPMIIIGGISVGILVFAVVGNIYASIISSFAGFICPSLWYKWYEKGQKQLESSQMERVSETMAAVLRSEGNIISALERGSLDCQEPLRTKLVKTANEIRLGVESNIAFDNLAKNVDVPEMMIISIGVKLQQQGMAINLASMFEQVQRNIRSRQALKEELNAITAENKMAGYIVAAIPFFTLAIMRKVSPDFVQPLFNTSIGAAVLILCTAVIFVGLYWLLQIAELKDY